MPNPDTIRLFPIQSFGSDYVTGTCSDGRRVVMGLLCPHLVAYFFNASGELAGGERREWKTPAPRMKENGPFKIHDPLFRTALAAQQAGWQSEIGFQEGPILVKAFLDARYSVGITLLPDHLEDEAIEELDEEERIETEAERTKWLESGQFVWWWAKDYWISKDGEVLST